MIKMEKFLISKGPYAIDPDSMRSVWCPMMWQGEPPPGAPEGSWRNTIQGVWFRRRYSVTVACIGELWFSSDEEIGSAAEFLERHTDGRYGGSTSGRWDGDGYWGAQVSLREQERHMSILRPMLENFPRVPPGYDGWWRF